MKLFLDSKDVTATLDTTTIDLPALIRAAGHIPFVKHAEQVLPVELEKFDMVLAQQQVNYTLYKKLITNKGFDFLQQELMMLDKGIANDILEKLELNFLNTKRIFTIDDVINFEDNVVLIKPEMSMLSRSKLDFAYVPMLKDELIKKLNEEISAGNLNLLIDRYLIQEAVTNNRPVLWIGGYVNPTGKIHIDGLLNQQFTLSTGYFEDKIRYPDRHDCVIEEVPLNEMDEFYVEAIRQIKLVLEYFQTKSTPFCIQAIVDDDDQVQLIDFNFGFGKVYALNARRKNQQYIIDRIKYTYGGADSIPPNNIYLSSMYVDTTKEGKIAKIKEYIEKKSQTGFGVKNGGMSIGLGQQRADRDSTVEGPTGPIQIFQRYKTAVGIRAETKQDALKIKTDFEQFLSTLD